MHEMSIARNIVDIVQQEIANLGEIKVRAVNVIAGKYTAVVPQQLAFCFSIITADTVLAGAVLNITESPLSYTCSCCEENFCPEEVLLLCPVCGKEAPVLTSGRELTIESIEVDD